MPARRRGIAMVGPFPPPLHGMSAVNAAVRERLIEAGAEPLVIDLAAPTLDRSLLARLGRLPRVLAGLGRLGLVRSMGEGTLYMSVSGGLGQAYDLLFLVLARIRGLGMFLHHHSYAYLDFPNRLTRRLIRVAGPAAVHITLSPGMASRLRATYKAIQIVPVSNSIFSISSVGQHKYSIHQEFKTIGYLGNISREKGVFTFLDLMAHLESLGLPLRAKIAGPFQDLQVEKQVHNRISQVSMTSYVGPKYGEEKEAFYSGIDAFVFPTQYANEAEPLAVHEAMSHGLPVIAYGRGAIPEIVGPDCGLVIDPGAPFVPAALGQIRLWYEKPELYRAASSAAIRRFNQTRQANIRRWEKVMQSMMEGEDAEASLPWKASALD